MQTRTFKAGVLAFGAALTVGAGLISSAVLARLLTPHDYGTFRQTLLVFLVAGPVLSMGLPNALSYFLPGEARRPRAVLYENILLLVALGVGFGIFLLAGGNRLIARGLGNPDLVTTLAIMAPYAMVNLPWGSFSTCLMVSGRAMSFTIVNVLGRLLLLACVLIPCVYWRSAEAALVGTVFSAALVMVPAFVLMIRSCQGAEVTPGWPGMKAQLAYAGPLTIASIFGTLSITFDKIIVSTLCDPATFAVYANGAMELPITGIVTGAATAVLLPEMAALYKRGQTREMLDLWKRSAVKCAVVIAPAMAGLLVLAPQFIRLLYSSKYVESTLPFIIYLLVLPGRVVTYHAIFMAAGRNGALCLRSVITLAVNVVISVALVTRFGYLGAAVGAVLALYLCEIPLYLHGIRRVLQVKSDPLLPYRDMARIFAGSFVAAVPVAALAHWCPLADLPMFLVGGGLYAMLAALVMQWLGYLDLRAVLLRWRAVRRAGPAQERDR